ncbi:MAG: Hsp20/alpha crystallin family protein [Chloroflexaceae bacterium]
MTSLTRWEPFEGMVTLRDAMNQLLADSFVWPRASTFLGAMLDLYETDNAYTVELAAPGLKPDQFEITLEHNVLTIRGQVKAELPEGARYHIQERRFGEFRRSITLPSAVDAEKIQANLKDGILTIHMPKVESARTRRIEIKAA